MKEVSIEEWKDKAINLTKWRENRTTEPNLDLYKDIVNMVTVGETVADVGAGQCHLRKCLPENVRYTAFDPFPLTQDVNDFSAEELNLINNRYDTVFMLSALDNVINVKESLEGLKTVSKGNIVILTGIGIKPDVYHTHQIDRKDLVDVLGEPVKEAELLKNVWLFEFEV